MKIPKIKNCKRCELHRFRRNIVVGRGVIPAQILFMGEAPGRSEDLTGESFRGRAGRILNKLILDAQITSFYIVNTVLCRPTDERQGDNREPSESEVLACTDNVMSIVKKVNPELVILLGKVAERYYGKEFPDAVCLHHPAFLLRQGGVRSPYYRPNLRKLKEAVKELDSNICLSERHILP